MATTFKRLIRSGALALACVCASPVVQAAIVQFEVPLSGAAEFPGPGDPDGSGLAKLFIDDVALTIDWDISVADILLPLTGAHIHQAPAGASGPIVVDFSAQLSGNDLFDADLAAILADPTGYYVNVHNSEFPGGALRGQLTTPVTVPEPGTVGLLALGLLGLARARPRQRSV